MRLRRIRIAFGSVWHSSAPRSRAPNSAVPVPHTYCSLVRTVVSVELVAGPSVWGAPGQLLLIAIALASAVMTKHREVLLSVGFSTIPQRSRSSSPQFVHNVEDRCFSISRNAATLPAACLHSAGLWGIPRFQQLVHFPYCGAGLIS